MGLPDLPEVLEIKRFLRRRPDQSFRCGALSQAPEETVVLFVSTEAVTVAGITLATGTWTIGYFWSDRPYNVYHWQDPGGRTLAYYFNIADETRLAPGRIEWRDLAVDVLLTPDGRVTVLDEDEVPTDAPAPVRAWIERGKAAVLASTAALVAEIEARSATLRRRLTEGVSGAGTGAW